MPPTVYRCKATGAEICAAYDRLRNAREVAHLFGISQSTVSKALTDRRKRAAQQPRRMIGGISDTLIED